MPLQGIFVSEELPRRQHVTYSAVLSQLLNGLLIRPPTERRVGTCVIGKVPGGQHLKIAVVSSCFLLRDCTGSACRPFHDVGPCHSLWVLCESTAISPPDLPHCSHGDSAMGVSKA